MPHEERTPAQTNQNRSAARPGNEHLGLSRIGTPLSGTEQLKRFKTANNTPNIYEEEEGDQYVFDGIMLAEKLAELAARERAHEAVINVLRNISVRERPRAITVILNPKTGKTYTGKSRGISSIETLHPWVKSLLPQVSLEGWDTHNCAEVHALDTLFKDVFGNVTTNGDNPQEMVLIEELLNGLEMHTVQLDSIKSEITVQKEAFETRTTKKSKVELRNSFTEQSVLVMDFTRCRNCKETTHGFKTITSENQSDQKTKIIISNKLNDKPNEKIIPKKQNAV